MSKVVKGKDWEGEEVKEEYGMIIVMKGRMGRGGS